MRLKNLFLCYSLLLLSFSTAQAQTGTAGLLFMNPEIVNGKFHVTLGLVAGTSFNLGSSNFRFEYNSSVIDMPVIVNDAFPWIDFSTTTTTGTNAAAGICSINTSYNGTANTVGIPIGPTPVPLVTVEFAILDPSKNIKLVWHTNDFPKTSLLDDDKVTSIILSQVLTDPILDFKYPDPTNYNFVKGDITADLNKNCQKDSDEILARNVKLKLANANKGTFYSETDYFGRFYFIAPFDSLPYTLSVVDTSLWESCVPNTSISGNVQHSAEIFPLYLKPKFTPCYFNEIELSTPLLRRCFTNTYKASYQNKGTAISTNTYAIITLDKYMTMESSPIAYTDLGNHQYRFELGEIKPFQQKNFNFSAKISCDSTVIGQTHCTTAEIFPKSDCYATQSKPSVKGNCATNKVVFTIKNETIAALANTKYIIIEDEMLFKQGLVPSLNPLETFSQETPANGSTWRMELRTTDNKLLKAQFIEGCGTNSQGKFSTGFATQFWLPYDSTKWIVTLCKQSIGSYDPNDKQGFPSGVGAKHFIEPGTSLDYLIRFQNTGTDTAFTVVVRDEIDAKLLDMSTLNVLEASHPFKLEVKNRNQLAFIFDNILLLDSFKNEPLSHGYIRFSISPQKDIALGAEIKNQAAIYFDFNKPVITNTTLHTIGRNFLALKSQEIFVPKVSVSLRPNPMQQEAILEVFGYENATIQLEIVDILGHLVSSQSADNQQFNISRNSLSAGLYFYRLIHEKRIIASGKMIAE
jgi:hypothetical protein